MSERYRKILNEKAGVYTWNEQAQRGPKSI
jgi:hypothetical protein